MRKNVAGSICLLLWVFLSFLLVALAPVLGAQDASSGPTISERLTNLKLNSKRLETLWREQKIAYSEAVKLSQLLEIELEEVRKLLVSSEQHLENSQQELTRSMTLFTQSQSTLQQLQTSFQEYQQSTTRQIRNRTIAMVAEAFIFGLVLILF